MKWDGLQDFYVALRKLPVELRDDATDIIVDAADAAYTAIYQSYPSEPTGNLRKLLAVRPPTMGAFGADVLLVNRAPHAWLYDNGTEARHYTTKGGKLHATGAMWGKSSPPHTFVRNAIRERLRMYEQLIALLESKGLWVSGSPYDA